MIDIAIYSGNIKDANGQKNLKGKFKNPRITFFQFLDAYDILQQCNEGIEDAQRNKNQLN